MAQAAVVAREGTCPLRKYQLMLGIADLGLPVAIVRREAVLQSPLPPQSTFSRMTRPDAGRQSAIVRSKAVL